MGFFIAILYSAFFLCSGWNLSLSLAFFCFLFFQFAVEFHLSVNGCAPFDKGFVWMLHREVLSPRSQKKSSNPAYSWALFSSLTVVSRLSLFSIFAFTSYSVHKLKLMVFHDSHGLHHHRCCHYFYRHCCLLLSIVIWYFRDSVRCPPAPCLDSTPNRATMLRIFAFQFQRADVRLLAAAVSAWRWA